jgi:hypothetical protein
MIMKFCGDPFAAFCEAQMQKSADKAGRRFRHHNSRASSGRGRQKTQVADPATAPLFAISASGIGLIAPDPGKELRVSRAAPSHIAGRSGQNNRLDQARVIAHDGQRTGRRHVA